MVSVDSFLNNGAFEGVAPARAAGAVNPLTKGIVDYTNMSKEAIGILRSR
jgi:hypothetical protein